MNRCITVELGMTTTDVRCGSCNHAEKRDGVPYCTAFHQEKPKATFRLQRCRDEEVQSDMRSSYLAVLDRAERAESEVERLQEALDDRLNMRDKPPKQELQARTVELLRKCLTNGMETARLGSHPAVHLEYMEALDDFNACYGKEP